jgi:DNA-directed RNA polymerase subunit RPC12/RpoP
MGSDISSELTGRMPIVPHSTAAGVDCCGSIIAEVEGNNVELRCNECGAVVGVVQLDILKGLLGLDCATTICPHCGKENTFPGFERMSVYTCQHCGKAVTPQGDRVVIDDDTCRWYTFGNAAPIAVMRCNRCGRHPDVDEGAVACPLCDLRSLVWAGDFIEAIEAWNGMVDPGD